MKFREKVFLGLLAMAIFWFVIFYPIIVPNMIESNLNPLIATLVYEAMFFATAYLLILFFFGEPHRHSIKIAIALFLAYHIFDAVEPPFILNSDGTWSLMGNSYIVSWDYAISHFLTNTFGIVGSNLYYITNIGGIAIMALLIWLLIKKENVISRVLREAI